MMAASCDNWTPPTANPGQVALNTLTVKNDDAEKIVNSTPGSRAETALSDYAVKIYRSGEAEPTAEYAYGSMPEIVTLEEGNYRIDVESHQVLKAEWDHPYFKGSSKEFAIESGKITPVGEITASFASIRVSLAYDDELLALVGDDFTVTVKANDEGELTFTPAETRSGYFAYVENSTTMVVSVSGTVGGVKSNNEFTFADLAPGQHRKITLGVKVGPTPPEQTGTVNPGGIHISAGVITEDVDGNVLTEEENQTAERPWQNGEEPDPGPGPDDPITFNSETLNLKGVNNPADFDGKSAVVVIEAENGIKDLVVSIDSELLTPALPSVGLAASFSLANPANEELEGHLRDDFGFPVGNQVINQKKVTFDITPFVPLLSGFTCDHTFILDVTDNEGNTKPLELKFKP